MFPNSFWIFNYKYMSKPNNNNSFWKIKDKHVYFLPSNSVSNFFVTMSSIEIIDNLEHWILQFNSYKIFSFIYMYII